MARPAPSTMAGVPVASGATASTRFAKASSASVALMSVAGSTCTRARPSGLSQSRRSSGGRSLRVTGASGTARRCRRSARTGRTPEPSAPSSSRRLAGSVPRFRAKASSAAAKRAAFRSDGRPLRGRGDRGARPAKIAEALDERRVVERRLAVRRLEGRADDGGGLGDDRALGVLVLRHEGLGRARVGHALDALEPRRERPRRLEVRRQHVEGVGRGVRVAGEVAKGLDRLGRLVLQVERVDVEAERAARGRPRRPSARGRRGGSSRRGA